MSSQKRNVVKGNVQVDLGNGLNGTVESSAKALDSIIEMAEEMWDTINTSGIKPNDDKNNNKLMEQLQEEYKDFTISYPIVFRWMIQAREYDSNAFRKFLQKHVKPMYKDRKEFMAAQGEYLIILYRVRHPRAGVRQIKRYREAITKSLQEDDDKFMAAKDEADEEVKRMDEENDKERRQRILQFLKNKSF